MEGGWFSKWGSRLQPSSSMSGPWGACQANGAPVLQGRASRCERESLYGLMRRGHGTGGCTAASLMHPRFSLVLLLISHFPRRPDAVHDQRATQKHTDCCMPNASEGVSQGHHTTQGPPRSARAAGQEREEVTSASRGTCPAEGILPRRPRTRAKRPVLKTLQRTSQLRSCASAIMTRRFLRVGRGGQPRPEGRMHAALVQDQECRPTCCTSSSCL